MKSIPIKPFDVTLSEDQKISSEEQILKRLKELTLEKINAICKEKIVQINANKQEVLNHITQEKTKATSEINEAKETDHYQNIDFFEFE
ncbi:hypothetical protein ACQJ6B_07800 [Helicobacter pylori]